MHIPRWGPIGWLAEAPEEVWFLFRIAAYAFFIGTVYWFVSYEPAGTMLLYGFGLAAGAGTIILGRGARHVRTETERAASAAEAGASGTGLEPDGPFGDERGRIPSPSYAPFIIGLGASVLGLGLVLGPWLIGVGLLGALVGGGEWLAAAGREFRAVDRPPAPRPADQDPRSRSR